MKLIHRHLMATFVQYLGYTLASALILFTLVDIFDHLGSLIDNHATIPMILRYYLFKSAWIIDLVLPIAMLMATLFTIGSMARYLELTALFAAGMSLMQIARPLVILSIAASLFSLAWREFVLPEANARMSRVWEVEIHKRPDKTRPTQDFALTGSDRRLYYLRRYDATQERVDGLKVLSMDGAQVTERIDAALAEWDGVHWVLQDGTRRIFTGESETTFHFDRLTVADLAITPAELNRQRVRPDEMNLRQLIKHNRLITVIGGDPTGSAVDIQFQMAFPLVNVVVVFLGIILASGPRKTTIASGFGLTVLVSFGYYLLMNFGRSLGHAGTIPPVVAGWAGTAVYAVLGWSLFMKARR